MGRRRVLAGLSGLLAAAAVPALAALPATPRQSAGPFYPAQLPLDDDNDLTRITGRSEPALGRIVDLGGRLLDRNGTPLAGRRIEIWQCDANGRYRHPADPNDNAPDPNFQGHGHTVTDAEGRYRFRTIRPVAYPGRTPHIHVAIFGDQAPFTTQIYVAGDPGNAEDFLYRRIPVELRPLVTAEFTRTTTAEAELAAELDLILGVA
jgi:protocatechuate 3,4-dioxygenase beta subunit